MPFGFRLQFLIPGGREGPETLDQPLSNFDVIGIPTQTWSSSFFGCLENLVPSCVLSFFCPCIMWAQIVVRAQIPLLISLKNSIHSCRGVTGYGLFVDYFFWSILMGLALLLIIALLPLRPRIVFYIVLLLLLAVLGSLLSLLGHTRTAFREKYRLPGCLPAGCLFWDMLLDVPIMAACLPCALSQMARHLFQYNRMDTELGLFVGDPATLPPLRPLPTERGEFERPARADEAGLAWTNNHPHPDIQGQRGRDHRQAELLERQRLQLLNENNNPIAAANAPPLPAAQATVSNSNTYRADGSQV